MNTHLIIQGNDVATPDLKQLAKLARATCIEAINQQAFRLIGADAQVKDAVARHCKRATRFLVSQPIAIKGFGLATLDMDSTLSPSSASMQSICRD
jgi:phosphoserine phosphatase